MTWTLNKEAHPACRRSNCRAGERSEPMQPHHTIVYPESLALCNLDPVVGEESQPNSHSSFPSQYTESLFPTRSSPHVTSLTPRQRIRSAVKKIISTPFSPPPIHRTITPCPALLQYSDPLHVINGLNARLRPPIAARSNHYACARRDCATRVAPYATSLV